MHPSSPERVHSSHGAALQSGFVMQGDEECNSALSTISATEKLRKFFFVGSLHEPFEAESQAVDLSLNPGHSKAIVEAERNTASQVLESGSSSGVFDIESLQKGALILGRYRLDSVLGKGGMGVVWKARDERQGVDRAIKFLLDKFHFDILKNEINSCQQLTHTNIVKIFEYLEDGGTHFISMEYLDGLSLDKLIKNGDVETQKAWAILENISSALSHIHAVGMVHADLKPANIIVTKSGIEKLVDFGIARFEVRKDAGGTGDAESVGGPPHACTLPYASKDVILGKAPQQRDDLYSLGCIAYELLSGGKHPFGGLNSYQASEQCCEPARINGLNARQWRAVRQALNFDRQGPALSVQDFWDKINPRRPKKRKFFYLIVLLSVLLIYQSIQPILGSSSIEDDVALKDAALKNIKVEEHHLKIRALLEFPTFDERWETDFHNEIDALSNLKGQSDPLVVSSKAGASYAYISHVRSIIEEKDYKKAQELIARTRTWATNTNDLDDLELLIDTKAAEQAAVDRAKEKQSLKAREEQKKIQFESALASINNDLKCNKFLSVEDLSSKIQRLKVLDLALYSRAEPKILDKVSSCISKVIRKFPRRGLKIKVAAEEIFDKPGFFDKALPHHSNNCSASLAGLGAKNTRSRCQDELINGTKGPVIVVIPGAHSIRPFAMSRYEVSIGEFNQFCFSSKECDVTDTSNASLPITSLSHQLVAAYLNWLSAQSGKTYRLPTLQEWLHVASAGQELQAHQSDDCLKESVVTEEHKHQLTPSGVGPQTPWGVVNLVGNVNEWVSNGGALLAIGDLSREHTLRCVRKHAVMNNSEAQAGIRVVRDI